MPFQFNPITGNLDLVGSSTFIGLTDVPATYVGQALELVRVNAAETALEFVPVASLGVATLSFTTIACSLGTSPVADSSTDTLTLTAGTGLTITGDSTTDTVAFALNLSAIDHNSLGNLTVGDVHTHYVLLAGRATPQQINFGTASGASTGYLSSTAHATKGKYFLNAAGDITIDEANGRFGIGTATPASLLQVGPLTSGTTHYTISMAAYDATTGYPQILFNNSGTNFVGLGVSTNGGMTFGTAGPGFGSAWTDQTMTFLQTGDVVIGGTTALSSAKLSIDGDGDQIQFLVQGNATQTSSLVVWETSAGTDLLTFSNAGVGTVTGQWNVDNLRLDGNTLSTVSGGPTFQTVTSSAFTFSSDTANNDLTFTFSGTTASGQLKWMEDEDYFEFNDDIFLVTSEAIYGRQTSNKLYSRAADIFTLEGNSLTEVGKDGNIRLGVSTLRVMYPTTDQRIDLGSATNRFNDCYFGQITITDAKNIILNTTTGTKFGTGTTQKMGWWNATPVVQSTGWSVTNVTTDKSFDANATTIDELADVVGTMMTALLNYGLLGA